jgi:AraC family transcriptional regulator
MPVTYAVEEIRLAPQTVATIRETTTLANVGAALAEVFGAIQEYLKEMGVAVTGPPFARFHKVESSVVDLEAGFPIAREVPRRWRIRCGDLPGGAAVAVWHVGPYETMGPAHAAVQSWLAERGRRPNGPAWEVYYTDPSGEPDPSKWRTQVVQPLLD